MTRLGGAHMFSELAMAARMCYNKTADAHAGRTYKTSKFMALKAVIFDMDGTLGGTLPLCVAAYRRCAEELTGRCPAAEEVTRLFGISDRGVLGGLLGMGADDPALPLARLVKIYRELHHELCPAPFPGAVEMLRQLRACGLKLGLISGKEAATAEPTLDIFGMQGLFDWRAYGDPYLNIKEACLRAAMQHWGLAADELVYVGDAPSDITHSHAAGVRIINAAWAPGAAAEAAACLALAPDYRLDSFEKLLPLIQSI